MTSAALTQHPVRALTSRLGELKEEADRRIADLSSTLKHIEETVALLDEHNLAVLPDLGPVGNAARNAWRAQNDDAAAETYVAPMHRVA